MTDVWRGHTSWEGCRNENFTPSVVPLVLNESPRADRLTQPVADLIVRNAAQLLTCSTDRFRLGMREHAWIAISGETIAAVGSQHDVQTAVDCTHASVIDATGRVVAPGFVDSHTHLVFAGSRVDEYAARLTVADPAILTAMGIKTGVMATVEQTRSADVTSLTQAARARLDRMLAAGTTTVESKSGYGLETESELKILEVNHALNEAGPVDVASTFLGAHGFPPGMARSDYIARLLDEMIPAVAEKDLAEFADVWCDDGYYTAAEAARILGVAKSVGIKPKIHTDAYSYIGGSDLAADMRMISADHLNYTPRSVMGRLAQAGVIGVVMPALDFAVRHPHPFDVRTMIDEGMTLALATDLCPGCWVESEQFVMALACRLYGMSPAQSVWAATMGGALALGLGDDRGSVEVGKLADLQIWDVPTFEHVIYRLGGNVVGQVIKRGKVVVDRHEISTNDDTDLASRRRVFAGEFGDGDSDV